MFAMPIERTGPLLPHNRPKSIWLRYGLPITVLCFTYASFHTRSITPHPAATLTASASPIETLDISHWYNMLEQLRYRTQYYSITCTNVEFALCHSASCQAIPASNLSWCDCRILNNTGHLDIIVDSAYLLWSPVYRDVVQALTDGALEFATDLFCNSIRTDPFWIGTVSDKLAHTTPLLSLNVIDASSLAASPRGESEITDTQVDYDDSGNGCRINVTQCLGAPCYRQYANASTASCACPLKYVDVPVAMIEKKASPQSVHAACNDPTVCGMHIVTPTPLGPVPSKFASLDSTIQIHHQLLNLDDQSNPFHSEVCDWSSQPF